MSAPRYAVFFSPDDHTDLAIYGQRVLGRNADGHPVRPSRDDFTDPEIAALLSSTPAHYGFHATLKAPFCLCDALTERDLLSAVETLAVKQASIIMDSLHPKMLSDFVALAFDRQPPAIEKLAAECVELLEPLRAPLTPEDLLKRNPDKLSDTQKKYLYQFGYPFVMSEFRFHMTLTGSFDAVEHANYLNWLQCFYKRCVHTAPVLDRLAVFWQPDRATAFTRLAQFPFT